MSNIPNSNLPVPIKTLDKQNSKSENKVGGFLKNLFVKNFGLKLSAILISEFMWILYVAFL